MSIQAKNGDIEEGPHRLKVWPFTKSASSPREADVFAMVRAMVMYMMVRTTCHAASIVDSRLVRVETGIIINKNPQSANLTLQARLATELLHPHLTP